MAEKCTNTSGPPSCWINPNPFFSLNHFTVPRAMFAHLLEDFDRLSGCCLMENPCFGGINKKDRAYPARARTVTSDCIPPDSLTTARTNDTVSTSYALPTTKPPPLLSRPLWQFHPATHPYSASGTNVTKPLSPAPKKYPDAAPLFCNSRPSNLTALPMVGSRKLPLNAPVAGATFNFMSLLPTDDAVPVPFVAMDTLITM